MAMTLICPAILFRHREYEDYKAAASMPDDLALQFPLQRVLNAWVSLLGCEDLRLMISSVLWQGGVKSRILM